MKKYNPLLTAKLDDTISDLGDLSDVSTQGTSDGYVLTFGTTSGSWKPSAAGAGDMLKSDYVTGVGTVYNASRLGGNVLGTVQAHGIDAGTITSGTIGLARIPSIDDGRIPDLETLSYGAAFVVAQIPNLGASKITTGTFGVARHETLDNLNGTVSAEQIASLAASKITTGTFTLTRVPTMDDVHIPDLETLSYSGTFDTAQIPDLPTTKITTGSFGIARIPVMDDAHVPDLETLSYGATFGTAQIPSLGAYKVTTGTFNVDRVETLDNLKGTVTATKVASLPTSKITSGSFNADRIPILPTSRYGSAVLLTGDQTVGGTKTFGDIPILPASNPTADNEAARKAYVDTKAVSEGTYSTAFTFGSAQAIQDAGTAFTIGGFMTHGYIKEVKFRANYTCGTLTTVSALVNDASGILVGGTVIAYDNKAGSFQNGDYIEIGNEIMRINDASPGTTPLIVVRNKKTSGTAGFIDDNEGIVRLNSGFTLQLFKDSNKYQYEMPLELSALMTAKGVTDASISSGNRRIELSADLENVDTLDTVRIADTTSEECLVQHNTGDCVAAAYDFNLFVQDALGSHPTSRTVEKICKYDIPTLYKSTAGTLYGRLNLMEALLGSNLSININIKTDEF